MSIGYFFRELWNSFSILARLIFSFLVGSGFVGLGYFLKDKTNRVFSDSLLSIGFSTLLITNFVAKFYNTFDLFTSIILHVVIIVVLFIFILRDKSWILMFLSLVGGYFPIFFFGMLFEPIFSLVYISLLNLGISSITYLARFSNNFLYFNYIFFLTAFIYSYLFFVSNIDNQIISFYALLFSLVNYFIFLVGFMASYLRGTWNIDNFTYLNLLNISFYLIGVNVVGNIENKLISFWLFFFYTLILMVTNWILYNSSKNKNFSEMFLSLFLIMWFLLGFSIFLYFYEDMLILVFVINLIIFTIFSIKQKSEIFSYYSLAICFNSFLFLLSYIFPFIIKGNAIEYHYISLFMIGVFVVCLLSIFIFNNEILSNFNFSKFVDILSSFSVSIVGLALFNNYFNRIIYRDLSNDVYPLFCFFLLLFIGVIFIVLYYMFPSVFMFFLAGKNFPWYIFSVYLLLPLFFIVFITFLVNYVFDFWIIFSFMIFILNILQRISSIKNLFANNEFTLDFRGFLVGFTLLLIYLSNFNIYSIIPNPLVIYNSYDFNYTSAYFFFVFLVSSCILSFLGVLIILLYDYLKDIKKIDSVHVRLAGISLLSTSFLFAMISFVIQVFSDIEIYLNFIPFINFRFVCYLVLCIIVGFLIVRAKNKIALQTEDIINYKNLEKFSIFVFNVIALLALTQEVNVIVRALGKDPLDILTNILNFIVFSVYSCFTILLGIKLNSDSWKRIGFFIAIFAIFRVVYLIFSDVPALYKGIAAFIVGISLLVIGYFYNTLMITDKDEKKSTEKRIINGQ